MGYYDNHLEHHGIRGQKWGVRRFQNADGTLTAAGRKHYGEGSGDTEKAVVKATKAVNKIEKYSTRAAKWENKAANAKTDIGRSFSTSFAIGARSEADRRAAKATGESKGDAFGLKRQARALGSEAETYANIANKMKENAQGKTGKEYTKAMDKAIAHLATAENKETYAKAYSDAAKQKGIINKGVAYFNNMEEAKKMKVTAAGRKQTSGDKQVEAIGDAALHAAFGIATGGRLDVDTHGVSGALRDASYKKKNSADKRWDTLAKG